MKRIFAIIICLTLIISSASPCYASEKGNIIYRHEEDLGNGLSMTETITLLDTNYRSMSRAVSRGREYTYNGEVIAIIEMTATFRYDGNTVSVVSKNISKCETYDGWSFKQSSFTSSGGTVSLTGKLTKLLLLKATVDISLTCDKNGNIS